MYNFKKTAKLYLVQNGLSYKVEIYPDLSASQTFDEQGFKRKTLHTLADLHDHAVIVRANTANFSFTVPVFDQPSIQKELELSSLYTGGQAPSFDLYIESDTVIYKVENAVFETTTFNIARESVLTATLVGSASKIIKVATIPGTLQTAPTRAHTIIITFNAQIGATTLSSIINTNIEIANDIQWTRNDTIHESTVGNIIYPQNYVLAGREVKGSVTSFVTSENEAELTDTSVSLPLVMSINTNLLVFNLPSVVFTRRTEFGDLLTRTYDFRLNTNSTTVKPIYKGV